MTLSDCVAKYGKSIEDWKASDLQREAEARAEAEKFTAEAFEEIGLTPTRIDVNSAFFEYGGKEVHFVLTKGKYGYKGICRELGKCDKCDCTLFTDGYAMSMENVGHLLVDPQAGYHSCEFWVPREASATENEKTPREILLDALDAYIQSKIQINEE